MHTYTHAHTHAHMRAHTHTCWNICCCHFFLKEAVKWQVSSLQIEVQLYTVRKTVCLRGYQRDFTWVSVFDQMLFLSDAVSICLPPRMTRNKHTEYFNIFLIKRKKKLVLLSQDFDYRTLCGWGCVFAVSRLLSATEKFHMSPLHQQHGG